jgi:hypothetical protein
MLNSVAVSELSLRCKDIRFLSAALVLELMMVRLCSICLLLQIMYLVLRGTWIARLVKSGGAGAAISRSSSESQLS